MFQQAKSKIQTTASPTRFPSLRPVPCLIALCLSLNGSLLWSQQDIDPDKLLKPMINRQLELPPADQAKLTRSIYNATKTAKTAQQFTDLIDACTDAQSAALSPENLRYVTSIKGWALNRRGETRLETAKQFKAIGNIKQFQSIMDAALQDFDVGLINAPERHRSWNSRGIAHMVNRNWKLAARDFTEATKLKPDYAAAWFNRAETLFQANEFEAAANDYSTVIRLTGEDVEALTGRALSLLALGRIQKSETAKATLAKAMADLNLVIELRPQDPIALINRGDAFQDLAQWQAALNDYQSAQSLAVQPQQETNNQTTVADGSSSQAKLKADQRLAWLLASCPEPKVKDPKRALTLIESVIQKDGESQVRLETLAAAQAAGGNFETAKTSQKNAIRLASDLSEELPVESPAKVRLSLYEQNLPFQQEPVTQPETMRPAAQTGEADLGSKESPKDQ